MISERKRQVLGLFAQGRRHYKLMEFGPALESFKQALALDPADGPAQVYAKRCQHYLDSPPPDDWDGIWEMKTK